MKWSQRIAVCCFLFTAGLLSSCGGSSSTPPTPPTPPVVSCTEGQREFTFTNNSGQDLWLGITAGTVGCTSDVDCPTQAAGSCVGSTGGRRAGNVAGTCSCASDASACGSIASCNTSNHFCYWNLPTLTTAQINLANGATSNVCFPAPPTSGPIQWSGNIFARTGCNSTGQQCATGECGAGSDGICPTGTGGNPPDTLFEFTLSNQTSSYTNPDFYDISIINGINVGIAAGPVSGTFAATSGNPYSCATPGSTSPQGTLSACDWTIDPVVSGTNRSTLLRNVKPTTFTGICPGGGLPNSLGYCSCTADSNCSSSSSSPYCGLAMNASSSQQYAQVCGTHIGWWTADQLCGSSNNTSPALAPIGCTTSVPNPGDVASTYTNYFACTKPAGAANPLQAQSCYTDGAAAECCGCATSASADHTAWPSVFNPGFGGSDNGCYNNNSNWVTIAQPWLVYLKQACPTAYTYPFDDATSTFTCQGSAQVGAPKYQITFLPTH